MATCAHCGQRKGKRSCPALRGVICQPCCGQHRLQQIQCPPDCVYLGGLAALRDRGATFTSQDYNGLWEKLHAFAETARELRNEALQMCFEDRPEEWAVGLATGYIFYGHRDRTGTRLVDQFAATKGRLLALGEAAALGALQRAWASLFEITDVHLGTGLDLRDLLTGEVHQIRELSATTQLKRWDVLFAWLMPFPDHLELTGSACPVNRSYVERVRTALVDECEAARTRVPTLTPREIPGAVAWVVLDELRDGMRDFRSKKLVTTDGEELVFCKAHYRLEDVAAVRADLAALAAFEPAGECFTWLDRTRDPAIALGNLRLADNELVLETMSRERNMRGRALLEAALGASIVHRADSIQDMEAAMREYRAHPPAAKDDEVPDDVQREVIGSYMRDYYAKWIDQPIPALGNKTPRKAVKTKKGRAQVEELLRDLENTSARMPGGDLIDLAGMRAELGLAPAAPSKLRYDADAAPNAERWLDLDDGVKAAIVEAHHDELDGHPEMPNRRLHALVHVIVENQLAAGEPPETGTTLERLVGGGVSRHSAIHALGSVVGEAMFAAQARGSFDRAAMIRELAQLDVDAWR